MTVISLGDVQRAAVEAFAENGYAASGIRDIADRLGVSSGALYHYAANKEEILASTMQLGLEALIDLADRALNSATGPTSQLSQLVRSHVALQVVNPRTAVMIDQEFKSLTGNNRKAILALRDKYERYWTDSIKAGVEGGELRVRDVNVARSALLEMCNGISHWYRRNGRLGLLELQDVFAELALAMLGSAKATRLSRGIPVHAVRLVCEPYD